MLHYYAGGVFHGGDYLCIAVQGIFKDIRIQTIRRWARSQGGVAGGLHGDTHQAAFQFQGAHGVAQRLYTGEILIVIFGAIFTFLIGQI